MTDDKTKRGHPDRDLFNKNEPYEVEYAIQQLAQEFEGKKSGEIKKALIESAKIKNFHENRKMIMNSARLKLKNSK